MENLSLRGYLKERGGIFIGIFTLVESILKASLGILVLARNGFIGQEYPKLFDKERIHAEIYILLSIFGIICSSLLIHGSLRKSSGKIIWWIVFQGISIFHQIYFSVDVLIILFHEVKPEHLIVILVTMSILFLCCIVLEIFFMFFIVELYQVISESEIQNQSHTNGIQSISSSVPVRHPRDVLKDLTDRNNPMQSSIIKLLIELEGNAPGSDTTPLINALH